MEEEDTAVVVEVNTESPSTEVEEVATPETPEAAESQEEVQEPLEEEKISGVQKRINELTWKSKEAERQLQRLQDENDLLKQSSTQQAQPQQVDAQEPRSDDFEDYDEYIRSLSRYNSQKEFQRLSAEREQKAKQREFKERQAETQKKLSKGYEKYEDFEKTVLSKMDYFNDAPHVSDALGGTENLADVAYHLAQNPAELTEISNMNPIDAAVAIGKLDAKFNAPPRKLKSNAPPGVTPVGNGDVPPKSVDDMTAKEYRIYMNKKEGIA